MKVISAEELSKAGTSSYTENDPAQLKQIELIEKIRGAIAEGRAYAKFISGDRKGSICKLEFKHEAQKNRTARIRKYGSLNNHWYNLEDNYLFCVGQWTGKSHKPQVQVPHKDVDILIDYDGPTIWERFDAKKAKKEILENPDQKDIDGNILSIGDKVYYINARYGSGMELTRGTVKEFKVSVNSNSHSVAVVISNNEYEDQLSIINNPETMILRYN